ncbi:hypothetical protein ACIQM4_25155 [Streptomyces sp. NPDC091272]|uniref:hypothetical protein n=1 Tax=Streptomyces sp. NPDC091272 TaxID=3365981 RepID=UPI00381DA3F5
MKIKAPRAAHRNMLFSTMACAALAAGLTGCSDVSSDEKKSPATEKQASQGKSADQISTHYLPADS